MFVAERKCQFCGGTFTPRYSSQIKKGNGKFCSLGCVGQSRKVDKRVSVVTQCGQCRKRCRSYKLPALCRTCICKRAGKTSRAKHPLLGNKNPLWDGGGKYKDRHPEKVEARSMFKKGIRAGLIKRKEVCEKCGSGKRVWAHHYHGYEKPYWLAVVWLCFKCHLKAHGSFHGRKAGIKC